MHKGHVGRLLLATVLLIGGITTAHLTVRAQIGACPQFPANNIWNMPVTGLPVDAHSAAYIASIGATTHMHPDFGAGLYNGGPIGIPYALVPPGQPAVPITFDQYGDESDPGPYPIPPSAPIEGDPTQSGDHHVLVVDQGTCKLYEMFAASPNGDGSWTAGSGAVFDLTGNGLRTAGWTSADAAGLPILPGLVRHDEVASGAITHALRFTVPQTRNTFIWPARHKVNNNSSLNVPPMGQRFRLKANVPIAGYSHDTQIILTALKTYGMFIADIGSAWYLSGVPDDNWNNDQLVGDFNNIHGSDFEAVDESALQFTPNSAESRPIVSSVSPPFAGGMGGSTVTITGGGFVSGAKVRFGGATGMVQNVTATTITAIVPVHPQGFVDIAVSNPSSATGILPAAFQYFPHAVAPTAAVPPNAAPMSHASDASMMPAAIRPQPIRH